VAYLVLYDVLDDSPRIGLGPTMLAFAVLWTSFWVFIHRFNPHMPPERRRNWRAALLIGPLFTALALYVLATDTFPGYVDQRRCREWARQHAYETVEGPVVGFRRDAGKNVTTHFKVGEIAFSYDAMLSKKGGFQGEFTVLTPIKLRDGPHVRVAHREGRILRMEVAEGELE
jgi:hypothetical protein